VKRGAWDMPFMVKDFMEKKVIEISEDSSLKNAIEKISINKSNNILVRKNDKIIGVITEKEIIQAIKLIKDISKIKINEIMSDFFQIIDISHNLDNEIDRMIKGEKIKLLVIQSKKGDIIGTISNYELTTKLAQQTSKIVQNHRMMSRQVRHDLRGSIFTLNTSIALLEKTPEKSEQVIEIMKKTLYSMNQKIEDWKKNEQFN
jgi:predicted transcriptional regulator